MKLGFQERTLLKKIIQQKLDGDVIYYVNGRECDDAEEIIKAMDELNGSGPAAPPPPSL